jgi:NTE family protein
VSTAHPLRRATDLAPRPFRAVTFVRGRDRSVRRALAARLADALAKVSGWPVALVVPARPRSSSLSSSPALPSVVQLAPDSGCFAEHARRGAEPVAQSVLIELDRAERSDEASREILSGLARHYAFVVAQIDQDDDTGPVTSPACVEHDGRRIHVYDDADGARTCRAIAEHARRARGEALPVAGLSSGECAMDDVLRLAREIAGLTVGIALGAGGWRGFAHVGVLTALRRHGVPVDCIAGSSVGAVVAVLWAFGHPPEEIMKGLRATRSYLLRPPLPWRSLLGNAGVRAHVERSAAGRSFEDAPIPTAAVATDLHDGTEVVLTDGPLWPAVLASSSIPAVYPAVELGGRWLVDGGVVAPVPVAATRRLGAKVAIGVRLDPADLPPRRSRPTLVAAMTRAIDLMLVSSGRASGASADVLIAPRVTGGGWRDAERSRALGEQAAEEALPALRARMPWIARGSRLRRPAAP